MSMSAAVTLALLFFLSVALNEQVTEGCTCLPEHPQQQFCESDFVIRAQIIQKLPSIHPLLTAYEIQTIQRFKLSKGIQVIYTPHGMNLNNGDYLLSGHFGDGVAVVNLCDRVEPWNNLSSVQERYLNLYWMGCGCKISPCFGKSCLIEILQKNCLVRINDSLVLDDEEALQSICLPGNAGFCTWHKFVRNYKSS
ncbi:metalloproteinase inhibitor 3-like [Onychostoma macrolepis]|uniref:metalloproteinase inhibitor 3-like n=1 Tax=Onychostoma macrolepis TaxID=369639 RepID=UPI00272C4DA2|nr:metalloproteinase inhibitor 3-like [Onychostoma macrolepis]